MVFEFGDFELDEAIAELRRSGRPIGLQPKVFALLLHLVKNRQRVVPSTELFQTLGPGETVGETSLTRAVREARLALGDSGSAQTALRTIRGRGYRFALPVRDPAPSPGGLAQALARRLPQGHGRSRRKGRAHPEEAQELAVREMTLAEANLVVDYFHGSTPEHLEMLGVDPMRLPRPDAWRERMQRELALPIDRRSTFFVVWLLDDRPVGFSSCDKIVFGERASMHLHVVETERRRRGIGTECVRRSVDLYFQKLRLKSLFCEPNAFNAGPNRTLQRAGFKYVKTHMTIPGPLNYHQAVTQWVIER